MVSLKHSCYQHYFKGAVNHAHLKERKADEALALNKFDEAINYHTEAADILQRFLDCEWDCSVSKSASGKLSLQLQVRHHLSKLQLVELKKLEFSIKKQKNSLLNSFDASDYAAGQFDQSNMNKISLVSAPSMESVDSVDYLLNSGGPPDNDISKIDVDELQHQEIVGRLLFFVREQQNEILRLAHLLQIKDKENLLLKSRIDHLEGALSEPSVES